MTRIKICGITNIEDALKAVELGAHAVGFIFSEGPRRVDPEIVRSISSALPPFISKVGVFVNEEAEVIEHQARLCRLDSIQLHRSDNRTNNHKFSVPAIRAFRVANTDILTVIGQSNATYFLLDTYDQRQNGGSGRTFDWNIAREATKLGRVILAGGLNHHNVTEAIDVARPYAVDVSSGVEQSPGIKDHEKMHLFIKEVQAWDNRID
ncbi:MAG: phosphoribosylanthranilate isomerase [Candidatus Zixiibacteriota bacterium]|nr:MAG: phosphoribosylanthranilate isomerase [candidate division Zixibacteria bacterium]